jgi:hypothetical protein
VWFHFGYGALPVPVLSFTGPRTEIGLFLWWVQPLEGL